jgi:hypothetical protein
VAASKLFSPQIREKRGDALDPTEEDDMFMNVPVHPQVPRFTGPTDQGQPHYPLCLEPGNSAQDSSAKAKRRWISSSPQEDTKY